MGGLLICWFDAPGFCVTDMRKKKAAGNFRRLFLWSGVVG